MVLVNGRSASASEMVAGTLQDYNRALIVGSPTYGKATAQIVLPMDTTVDLANLDTERPGPRAISKSPSRSSTRINGTTAQVSGAKPDIILPDPPEATIERESDEPIALKPAAIEANKYYHPLPPLPVATEQTIANEAISTNASFFGSTSATSTPAKNEQKDLSLNLGDIVAEKKKGIPGSASDESTEKNKLYTVANPAYEGTSGFRPMRTSGRSMRNRKKRCPGRPYIHGGLPADGIGMVK